MNLRQISSLAGFAAAIGVAFLALPAPADLTVTDNMVLWLKADAGVTVTNGRVSSWADQSGLGHDATALSYGPRVLAGGSPSGQLDLLDFILDGSILSIADAAELNPGTGGYTVFVAGSPWVDTASRAMLSKAEGTSSRNPGYWVWANVSNIGSTNVRVTGGPEPDPDPDLEARRGSQSSATTGDVQVITMNLTGTSGGTQPGYVTGYRDGVAGWTNGGNGPTDNQYSLDVTTATDLYIGGYGYYAEESLHTSYPHRGTIGEVLIYNTELTPTDRASVESYLVSRWAGPAPPISPVSSHYAYNEAITPDPGDSRVVFDTKGSVHGILGRRLDDGTLVQNPTRVEGGVTGNALRFTRDAAPTGQEVHDFATGGSSAFYAPSAGAPLSFTAWINPDTISAAAGARDTDANRILALYREDGSTTYGTGIALSLGQGVESGGEYDGNLLASVRAANTYIPCTSTSTLSTADTSGPNGDGWHHVAFTYFGIESSEPGTGWLTLYIDGNIAGGAYLPFYTKGHLDYPVVIGAMQQRAVGSTVDDNWFTSGFDGLIDDVQFYNQGLTEADIQWLVAHPGLMLGENHPGDANGDGMVNDEDASVLGANWLRTGDAAWEHGDFNGDQRVDDRDAAVLAAHWHFGVGEAAVPEPSVVALLVGAIVVLFPGLKRKRLAL